jgi:hypothetical protein
MGAAAPPVWDFDVNALYVDTAPVNAAPLVAPFTSLDARTVVRAMNSASAPGPDGFSPTFYKAVWSTVALAVIRFIIGDFYRGAADLERINKAHVILLPKKPGATTVDAFRPICLQNCAIKITSKMLTTRLQRELPALIDIQQAEFL